mgnify:FL=1
MNKGHVEYDRNLPQGYDTEYTKLFNVTVTTDLKEEFEEIKELVRLDTNSKVNNAYVMKELIRVWCMWNNDIPCIPNPAPIRKGERYVR